MCKEFELDALENGLAILGCAVAGLSCFPHVHSRIITSLACMEANENKY